MTPGQDLALGIVLGFFGLLYCVGHWGVTLVLDTRRDARQRRWRYQDTIAQVIEDMVDDDVYEQDELVAIIQEYRVACC